MIIYKNSVIITTENSTSKYYINCLNSLRAIAIIIIIISHSINLTFSLDLGNPFYYSMGAFGVALFTFLSGNLLTRNIVIKQGSNHSWLEWYKKRIIRIIPLLILSTIFILFYKFFVFKEEYNLNLILIHMSGLQSIPTNPNNLLIMGPHWYITFILSCYLVFPVLYYFLNKRIKLTIRIGIIIYLFFIVFHGFFYYGIEYLFSEILHIYFKINFFRGYFPMYFIFFFGMMLGYNLGRDHEYVKNIFNIKIKKKATYILLLFIFCLLSIILGIIYEFPLFSDFSYLCSLILLPLITIFLTIVFMIYLDNKNKFNNILNILGTHSYEVFLIHLVPISMLALLKIELELYFIYLPIAILISIILSHPFYFFGKWISRNKRIHVIVITFSSSLIIYSLIIYVLQLQTSFNDLGAFLLFFTILSIMIEIMLLKRYSFKSYKT